MPEVPRPSHPSFPAFPVFLPLSVSASIPGCACPCMCGYLLASVRSVCLNLHSRVADFQGRNAKGIFSPQKVEKSCLRCFALSTLERVCSSDQHFSAVIRSSAGASGPGQVPGTAATRAQLEPLFAFVSHSGQALMKIKRHKD